MLKYNYTTYETKLIKMYRFIRNKETISKLISKINTTNIYIYIYIYIYISSFYDMSLYSFLIPNKL